VAVEEANAVGQRRIVTLTEALDSPSSFKDREAMSFGARGLGGKPDDMIMLAGSVVNAVEIADRSTAPVVASLNFRATRVPPGNRI
jgi:hypothetical protein